MSLCEICPRHCSVEREAGERGFCGAGKKATVSYVCRHYYEEPPISAERGSGAVFFGGCNLACVFCQNKKISRSHDGDELDEQELASLFLRIEEEGAENINLVSPTPHLYTVEKALKIAKKSLKIPVVYNTGSYETREAIKRLEGLVDVYLPDIKYSSDENAKKYSKIKNYPETAFSALDEMLCQQPSCVIEDGRIKRGVIVRHLCLPTLKEDSFALLERLSIYLKDYDFLLSLMSQYTPSFLGEEGKKYREINRKLTSLEYKRISERALSLGFSGFFQDMSSAVSDFTPDF